MKYLILIFILIIFFWYVIRPQVLSKNICESTYVYHSLIENGVLVNYHTASGVTGPTIEFSSKKSAIKSCTYFHKKMYRSSFPFYLF